MAGIRSIGWYIPAGRRNADAIARDYGVAVDAVERFGLRSHAVAADNDHPSTMATQAARAALTAAELSPKDIDLLIFTGMTRDYPTPWVGAFGVLHELQATQAAGFDLSNRCPGLTDALWLAATLVRSGAYDTIVVCVADRFDYLLGPPRRVEQIADTAYSAGAGAAVVSRVAQNEIVAFSHLTNPDLSLHAQFCPRAGGSRRSPDPAALAEGMHQWQATMRLSQTAELMKYLQAADHHNITSVCRQAGFDEIDFLASAPLDVKAHIASLAALGIGAEKTLLTLPELGHMGGADAIVTLGLAAAIGRDLGRRVVLSTRSVLYANALAIRALGASQGISAGGTGLDTARWRQEEERRIAAIHGHG
jgi:3-oxoacyl-[acyl-carrier-protein] synthase-3